MANLRTTEAERASVGQSWDEDFVRRCCDDIAELSQENANLREYVRHHEDCESVLTTELVLPCSCGLDDLLNPNSREAAK